jgi:hypothetical protein
MKRLAIVLLALLACGWGAASALAQSSPWAKPFRIGDPDASSWFPTLAAGPDGTVFVTWSSSINGGPQVLNGIDRLLYRELRGGAWSRPNDIVRTGTGGFVARSGIAVGRDSQLHVLVRNQVRVDYIRAPWDNAWSAQSWTPPRRISNGSTPYYDLLAIDNRGTLHAFWNESTDDDPLHPRTDCSRCSDLFYRRSSDGGEVWSPPINLSQTPEGSIKPQVKIDTEGRLHVVWSEGYDNINGKGWPSSVMYRQSSDDGAHWDAPVRFTLPGDAPQQAAIGLFQNTTPVIVYRATKAAAIYYQVGDQSGTRWSQPALLPGVQVRFIGDTTWDCYTIATDGAGKLHLVMVGLLAGENDQQATPRLLHLVWDGRAWSAPEVIVADGLFPEWPNAVISGGNQLHLTWFTRSATDRYTPDAAHYQVWYSHRTLDAPAQALLPFFTPVPTQPPAPTPAPPTPPPTPTPLAAADIGAPALAERPAWESSGLLAIFIAVLPTVGLLGVLLAILNLIRRRHHS